jgi:hypothetical protein
VGNSGDGNAPQVMRTAVLNMPFPRARRRFRERGMDSAVRSRHEKSGAEMKTGAR